MYTYYYLGSEVTPEELKDFVDYVYSFYNVVDGVYPVYGCTKIKIQVATGEYFDRILKGDLLNLMGANPPPSERKIKYGQEERIKMTRLRQTIAKRLKQAQENAAILSTFNDVDMTNVV